MAPPESNYQVEPYFLKAQKYLAQDKGNLELFFQPTLPMKKLKVDSSAFSLSFLPQ